MKPILIIITAALLSGCAAYTQTSFARFEGPSEFKGRGGTVKTVDGIDIWTTGEPNRRFRVLGLIDQAHYDNNSVMSFVAGATKDSALIATAKQQGGDAIIFIGQNSVVTGFTTTGWATGQAYQSGYSGQASAFGVAQTDANTRTDKRVAVVKYLK